jgi:hypothetical protein
VVTIYATLGDEAIAHGINETEVSVVITSHDLLPKFRNILSKTPKVKKLIYMEDQLAKTDVSGYKSGVDIIPFSEVVKNGASSDIRKFQNLLLLHSNKLPLLPPVQPTYRPDPAWGFDCAKILQHDITTCTFI